MLLKFEDIKDKEVVIEQVKSTISTNDRQKANLRGLGLDGIRSKSILKCTAEVYGMIKKVSHLIKVELK